MSTTKKTATETSAVVLLATGVTLLLNGTYIGGAALMLGGVALFAVYERIGLDGIEITEDQAEEMGEAVEDAGSDVEADIRDELE